MALPVLVILVGELIAQLFVVFFHLIVFVLVAVFSYIAYGFISVLYFILLIFCRVLRSSTVLITIFRCMLTAAWVLVVLFKDCLLYLKCLILQRGLYPSKKSNLECDIEEVEPVSEENIEDMSDEESHEYLSYPMSLLHALRALPKGLGQDYMGIQDITTLTIHVVTTSPLVDSESWMEFIEELPELKRLNLIYVTQNKSINQSFDSSTFVMKNRSILYAVQHMHYHMYFSSSEYIEPDVVVVYDMATASKEDDVHNEISYRNMTSIPETIVVLMDAELDVLKQEVIAVDTTRPVKQLVLPNQIKRKRTIINFNPGFKLDRTNPVSVSKSKTHYFTCLQRK